MSEAILYDPATDMPIFFNPTGDPPEAPIYNLEKTTQYLHISITGTQWMGNSYLFDQKFQFTSYGYSSADGKINKGYGGIDGVDFSHLVSQVQGLDKFSSAPLRFPEYVLGYQYRIRDSNIRLDLLKQFGYGLSGTNYEIVVRRCVLWGNPIDPDDNPEPTFVINETVSAWIDDDPTIDVPPAGAQSLAVVCPWLPGIDYASPNIPGAEAQMALIRIAVADDSITIS